MGHLVKVVLYSLLVTLAVGYVGLGMTFAGSIFAAAGVSAVIAAFTTVASLALLIGVRAGFKLMQTGRLIQFLVTWVIGAFAIAACAGLFPGVLAAASAFKASAFVVAGTMIAAVVTGQAKGRTWLPVRMK